MKKIVKTFAAVTCAVLFSTNLFAQEVQQGENIDAAYSNNSELTQESAVSSAQSANSNQQVQNQQNETLSQAQENSLQAESSRLSENQQKGENRDLSKNQRNLKKSSVATNEKITLDKTEYEIPLHILDYSNSFPGLNVSSESGKISNHDVKWTSSDKKVVKVDQKGRLFPKSLGEATVTATTKGGETASCKIIITKYGPKPSTGGMNISTQLTGDASVTFGLDLDTGRAAFCTDQNIKLKMDLLNLGEVWAGNENLPLWGEIRIYTQGDPLRYMVDADSGTDLYENSGDFAIVVDRARVHLGPAYLTIYNKDDSDLGYVNYTTGSDIAYAFMAADTNYRYGHLKRSTLQSYFSTYDENSSVYGLNAGYEMDGIFKVQGDFASTMKWIAGNSDTTQDTADLSHNATDWIYKISADFTMISDLTISAGYSNGILGKDSIYMQDMRLGFGADYEWNFYDIYYLKPSIGANFIQLENSGDLHPLLSAGLMLGWEDKQSAFDYWSIKYSEDDYGPYPGVALAVQYADSKLAENCTYFVGANELTTFNDNLLIFHASFNTGNDLLVKNLEAVGAVDFINVLSDSWVMGWTLAAHYNLPIFDSGFKVSPKALITRYHDSANINNGYCYVKGGLELGFERITVGIDWESNDILHGFNDGYNYNKWGNIETSVKVSF